LSIPFKKYGYKLNPITDEYRTPQIFLVNKRLQKIGELYPIDNLKITVNEINQADEISFTYHKIIDGQESPLFNKVDDLSIILVDDYGYFEIAMEKNENSSISKSVTGISLGHAELSQILTTLEVNTEDDYNSNNPTVFYRKIDPLSDAETIKKNKESSLLHRILSCAPHYRIGSVDETLQNIQRMYSWSDKDILSIFNDIADEINCVFDIQIFLENGIAQRIINVHDLQYCSKCYNELDKSQRISSNTYKYRTIINGKCKSCGHSEFINDIGKDTNIFICTENLTDEISIRGDKDSIKNCFKVTGGDDMISDTVHGLDMSSSDRIVMFSDKQKQEMSTDLRDKLERYDKEYKDNIDDYISLLETEYNIFDLKHYLQSGKMPAIEKDIMKTDEALVSVLQKISSYYQNKFYISSYDNYEYTSTRVSIQNMFTTFMPEGFSFTIDFDDITEKGGSYNPNVLYRWYGKIRIYSTGNRDENYTLHIQPSEGTYVTQGDSTEKYIFDDTSVQNIVNNFSIIFYFADKSQEEYLKYIEQHTKYILSTFDLSYENEKKKPWNLYSYNRLDSFYNGYIKCISTLEEMKRTEVSDTETYKILTDIIANYQSIKNDILAQMNVLRDQIFAICSYHGEYESDFLDSNNQVNYHLQCYPNLQTVFDHLIDPNYEGGYQDDNKHYKVNEFVGTKPFQCKKCGSSNVSVSSNGNVCNNANCGSKGADIYSYFDIAKNIYDSYSKHKNSTIIDIRGKYHNDFDIKKYLGDELYAEYRSFIREDVYHNENYISDGLNNAQLIEHAKELRSKAEQELSKACQVQYTIDLPLSSIVAQKSFEYQGITVNDDYSEFKINNFVRVRIDDEIFKMRISSIGFTFPVSDKIEVSFTNVTNYRTGTTNDIKDIINKAENMATSYSYIVTQAEKGNNAYQQFDSIKKEGLDASLMAVKAGRDHDIVIDEHGILLRRKIQETDTYSDCQMKLIDRNLVMTMDNWKTAELAIGLGMYNGNPIYGIWANLLYGDLTITKELHVKNDKGSVFIDENGIEITNGNIKLQKENCSVTIDPSDDYIFNISNATEKIMYVDENGNGHFNGTIHASDGSFVGTVTAKNISATKGTIGGWDIKEYSLSSGDYNNNFIQFDSSGKSIISKNGDDKVVITSGHIQFLKNSSPYTTIHTTGWAGTSVFGVGINSEEDAKFISFGNKNNSSDGYYTTSLLLNYGLNPNGDKQDVIIYGTTKVTGEISLESNIKLNNNSFFGASPNSSGAYFSHNIFTGGGIYPGNVYDSAYKLYVNGNSYFNGSLFLSENSLTSSYNINLGFSTSSPEGTSCNAASVYWTKETFESKSSDERVKENFCTLPENIDNVFDSFNVRQYEYKEGLGRSGKYFGETSQHIEDVLSENGWDADDYAVVGLRNVDCDSGENKYIDEEDKFHYIDNSNIIWLCVDQIQKLKKRVAELEEKLSAKDGEYNQTDNTQHTT